jgi:uncharacterized RDD family membrane protein YckC
MENNNFSAPNTQQDMLGDDLSVNPMLQYEYASKNQRFFNLLIDNLLLRYGLSYATGYLTSIVIAAISPDFLYDLVYTDSWKIFAYAYLIGIINYLIYYTLCEKLFRGYTLGKLITGTRAIREDGGELTIRDAFMRSLSRIVPFEAFSGFGDTPWHDSWTKTIVIKSR